MYRAFPELDQFDDEVCRLYVRRARKIGNAWRGAVLVLLILPVAIVVWIIVSWALQVFNDGLMDRGHFLPDVVDTFFILFIITGFVWFPIFCMLLVRDRWLNRCIKKQLKGSLCGACGYSLVGLDIIDHENARAVQCPECGSYTTLNIGHITEADIDPTLLVKE